MSALAYAAIGGAVLAPELAARLRGLPPCQTVEGAAAAAAIRAAGGTPTCDPDKPVAHNSSPWADAARSVWSVLSPGGLDGAEQGAEWFGAGAAKWVSQHLLVTAALVGAGIVAWKVYTR
jgi:hypothetical protein